MKTQAVAVGLAIGLILGVSLSLFGTEELASRGLLVRSATIAPGVPIAARERPRLATSLQPTRVPPRCDETAKVIHQFSLVPLGGEAGGLASYYVLGTVRNTCTVPLEVVLKMFGVSDPWPNPNQLSSLGQSATLALAPGQERAFYHGLGQHRATDLQALIVVPKCWVESGRSGAPAEFRRCHDLPLKTSPQAR